MGAKLIFERVVYKYTLYSSLFPFISSSLSLYLFYVKCDGIEVEEVAKSPLTHKRLLFHWSFGAGALQHEGYAPGHIGFFGCITPKRLSEATEEH